MVPPPRPPSAHRPELRRTPIQWLQHWGFSLSGLRDNRHGEWWLFAQLLLILALGLPAWPQAPILGWVWPTPLRWLGLVLVVLALVVALLAFRQLGASLTPLPEPMPTAPLVTSGLYARCRHPLYTGVLIGALGMVLLQGSLLHLALLLGLAAVLGGKARREERSLIPLHPSYGDYRSAVAAILPHVPWLDWRA